MYFYYLYEYIKVNDVKINKNPNREGGRKSESKI